MGESDGLKVGISAVISAPFPLNLLIFYNSGVRYVIYTFPPPSPPGTAALSDTDKLIWAEKHEVRKPQACLPWARILAVSVCDPIAPSLYIYAEPSCWEQLCTAA